ncbi:vacuolar-sorting protein SNF7 [Mycena crocata]|nr:vacuolar-sorting protein SNF7 [Mycena crocata]
MDGVMRYFGRRDTKKAVKDTLVDLRQQIQILDKKGALLETRIEQELNKARENAAATAALRRKRAHETQLDQLRGQQVQLEIQADVLASASMNAETATVMKRAAEVMKTVHAGLSVASIDKTMGEITDQLDEAKEIAELLTQPIGGDSLLTGDEELEAELRTLEDEVLRDRLAGATHVPEYLPPAVLTSQVDQRERNAALPDSEEATLRQMQAEMASMM